MGGHDRKLLMTTGGANNTKGVKTMTEGRQGIPTMTRERQIGSLLGKVGRLVWKGGDQTRPPSGHVA